MNKGLQAAKQQEWEIAIQNFQEARKAAPNAPEIFFNLGLAESKIPGRELRSIAWFAAYLAASPHAPNASAVKNQIDALDVKSQSNLLRMIKSVQDAASKISDNKVLQDVAVLWAETGDIARAQKAADLIHDARFRSFGRGFIAQTQAKAGDIAGAQKTADLIQVPRAKSGAQEAIAAAQAKAGDIASARQTAGRIRDEDFKSWAQAVIAEAQAKAGDIAGAQETADPIEDGFHKIEAQTTIAEAQVMARDISGAKKTCASALRTADLIQNAAFKNLALATIAVAQAKAGDIAGAQATADLIQDAENKALARGAIAETQTRAATTNLPPLISVSDWLNKLDDGNRSDDCALNTDPFLDLASYLKSLPSSDNPKEVYDLFCSTTQKIAKAQNIIDQMLK